MLLLDQRSNLFCRMHWNHAGNSRERHNAKHVVTEAQEIPFATRLYKGASDNWHETHVDPRYVLEASTRREDRYIFTKAMRMHIYNNIKIQAHVRDTGHNLRIRDTRYRCAKHKKRARTVCYECKNVLKQLELKGQHNVFTDGKLKFTVMVQSHGHATFTHLIPMSVLVP